MGAGEGDFLDPGWSKSGDDDASGRGDSTGVLLEDFVGDVACPLDGSVCNELARGSGDRVCAVDAGCGESVGELQPLLFWVVLAFEQLVLAYV